MQRREAGTLRLWHARRPWRCSWRVRRPFSPSSRLLGRTASARLDDIQLGIEIVSPDERGVHSVSQAWLERCPVYLGLIKSMKVATTIEIAQG